MAMLFKSFEDPQILLAEVMLVNVPYLQEDLSSAKYTFLSFSEKTRNEVKQKLLLLPEIQRRLAALTQAKQALADAESALADEEVALVRSSPPKMVAAAPSASASAVSNGRSDSNAPTQPSSSSKGEPAEHVVVLTQEDMERVRAAEAAVKADEATYCTLAQQMTDLEDKNEVDREASLAMTTHVQRLKSAYEQVRANLDGASFEYNCVQTKVDEITERNAIYAEQKRLFRDLHKQQRVEELSLAAKEVGILADKIETTRNAIKKRKDEQELEIASYMITFKEQQGSAEVLRYQISNLQKRITELEEMAKRQELIQADRSSIRSALRAAFMSSSKPVTTTDTILTPENKNEMDEQKYDVLETAARIAWVLNQREEIIRVLRMKKLEEDTETSAEFVSKCAARIRELMRTPIPEDIVVSGEEVDRLIVS